MTKSKIDLSAAPNAAFQIKTESGPSEPIKPPATEEKKSDKPSLADAYTEKKDRWRYFSPLGHCRKKSGFNASWLCFKGRTFGI